MEKLAKKYEESENKGKEKEEREFEEFERKREKGCKQGRCEYITRIIDEFEGARPKSDEF
jgi:hypothetical protein